MFNKKYKYHVSYFADKENKTCFGSCISIIDRKIKYSYVINSLKRSIEQDFKVDNVVILNWIRIK